MFFHNFKYSLKTLFKNRMLLFWTFAFPIILGTFFHMAFSDIENNEKLNIIEIAIVENDSFRNNPLFTETFQKLGSEDNEEQIFHIQYVNLEEAKDLLASDKVVGYLLLEDSPKIVVGTNGINETIFKYVVEEIAQMEDIFGNVLEYQMKQNEKDGTLNYLENGDFNTWYTELYRKVAEMLAQDNTAIQDISSSHLSYTMIEYYTLIAMACLYGGILGMVVVNQCLANMSSNGKRVSISPISKGKLVCSSALASYVAQLFGLLLLFLYTLFVLHVDYGDHLELVVLLSLVGSLAGLSLGVMVASVFPSSENTKTGIILSVTMLGCFLSGMMGITMKYIVDQNFPLINRLNPVSMITDGFYALYYYDTFDRFYFNVFSLLIFSFILILLSMLCLRRQKYDSI